MSQISVPVSYGELIDKITILEIKFERIADAQKRANVRTELDLLNETWAADAKHAVDIGVERGKLKAVNAGAPPIVRTRPQASPAHLVTPKLDLRISSPSRCSRDIGDSQAYSQAWRIRVRAWLRPSPAVRPFSGAGC